MSSGGLLLQASTCLNRPPTHTPGVCMLVMMGDLIFELLHLYSEMPKICGQLNAGLKQCSFQTAEL